MWCGRINHRHDHSECCWWKCGNNYPQTQYCVVGLMYWELWPQSMEIMQHVEPIGLSSF